MKNSSLLKNLNKKTALPELSGEQLLSEEIGSSLEPRVSDLKGGKAHFETVSNPVKIICEVR